MRGMIGMLLVVIVTFNLTTFAPTSDGAKIKVEITKRCAGEKARVRITTRDKEQLEGISAGSEIALYA